MPCGIELHEPGGEVWALGEERFGAHLELAACGRPTAAVFEAATHGLGRYESGI